MKHKFLKILGIVKLLILKTIGYKIDFDVHTFFHPTVKIVATKNSKIILKSSVIMNDVEIVAKNKSTIVIQDNAVISEYSHIEAGDNAIIKIDAYSFLNRNSEVYACKEIIIGKNVAIGPDTLFIDHDHIMKKNTNVNWNEFKATPISIGDNNWIGGHAIILRGSKTGSGCIIAGGSIYKDKMKENQIYYCKLNKIIKDIE